MGIFVDVQIYHGADAIFYTLFIKDNNGVFYVYNVSKSKHANINDNFLEFSIINRFYNYENGKSKSQLQFSKSRNGLHNIANRCNYVGYEFCGDTNDNIVLRMTKNNLFEINYHYPSILTRANDNRGYHILKSMDNDNYEKFYISYVRNFDNIHYSWNMPL